MSTQQPGVGAARQYAVSQLGGPVFENETTVTAPTNVTQPIVVVDNNGDRVVLIIINFGTVDAIIGLNPGTTFNLGGIRIPANGGGVSFDVRDDFTLPAQRWYGLSISAVTTALLIIIEVVRYNAQAVPK